jgi:hypothetical protein
MTVPFLPDWLPWWVPILVAIPAGLWVLTMLIMPFSVIGVKSRLEGIEARLDELDGDLRALVLRLPESPAERMSYRPEHYTAPAPDDFYAPPVAERPPIPPEPRAASFVPRAPRPDPGDFTQAPRAPDPRGDRPPPSPRAEPRLDWRRS